MKINGFDFDGVVSLGITPGENDVIISGRCFDEAPYVNKILRDRGIMNAVYLNPIAYKYRGDKTKAARTISGEHKADVIAALEYNRVIIDKFFEDDELQASIIKKRHKKVNIVLVKSNLVTL